MFVKPEQGGTGSNLVDGKDHLTIHQAFSLNIIERGPVASIGAPSTQSLHRLQLAFCSLATWYLSEGQTSRKGQPGPSRSRLPQK